MIVMETLNTMIIKTIITSKITINFIGINPMVVDGFQTLDFIIHMEEGFLKIII